MSSTPYAVVCAVAVVTLPLAAQDRTPVRRVGVGITVPDVGLSLPINVGSRFHLEPYTDFFSARADYPVTSDSAWQSNTQIGLGVFVVTHPQERFDSYFGPRLGYIRGSTKVNGTSGQTSTKSDGWFVAGAI